MNKKITYGKLFELFTSKYPKLKPHISDYRPYECYALQIWLNNGKHIIAQYNKDNDKFEVKDCKEEK